MNARNGQTVRKIPVAPGVLPQVLVGIRREADGGVMRWSLGTHGRCELSVPKGSAGHDGTTLPVVSTGWIFAPDDAGEASITVAVQALDERSCELFLDVISLHGPWFDDEPAAFGALRRAVLRELAEELRFHARSVGALDRVDAA